MKVKFQNTLYSLKQPILSYGVIAFTKISNKIYYVLINKKNTVGFCDIVKGNYDKSNIVFSLEKIVEVLTKKEVEILLTKNFNDIWRYMWSKPIDNASKYIFEKNKSILFNILKSKKEYWNETEWEFPKGRKEYQEKELECALREFEEETGISKQHINIIYNINPQEEMYIGTNLNYYKHKYFIGYINYKNINLNKYQIEEVSNLELFDFDTCNLKIRNYHKSKKECLNNVNYIVNNLNFFSPDINAP